MTIPLPFPKCPECGNSGKIGYHKDCGGELEIDPSTNIVICSKCDSCWDIWDSRYYCGVCGNIFDAVEVVDAVKDTLLLCKVCLAEIIEQEETKRKRDRLSKDSIRAFVAGLFERIGYIAGIASESVVLALSKLLFG